MRHLGDFAPLSTVYCYFSTAGADGARIAFSDALEAGDVLVYKNGSATQRSSTSGFTVTSAFDSLVGVHMVSIDTSDNTDAGFFAPGNEYTVVLYPDTETVDTKAPAAVLGSFSIARKPAGCVLQGTAQAGGAGTVTLPSTAVGTDSYYNGDLVVVIAGTGIGQSNVIASYVGSTKVATMGANWVTTPDSTSVVQVFPGTAAPVDANMTKIASQTVTAAAGVTFPSSLASPTNITAGTITTATNVTTVNGLAAGVITAASIAGDAFTAAKFAADVTTELQSGLATAAALSTLAGYVDTEVAAILAAVDTEIAAIKAKTDQLVFTAANQLDVQVLAMAANVVSSSALATSAVQEIADGLLDRDMSTGTDSGSPTVRTVRQALRAIRNKSSVAAGTLTVTKEDDTTASWTAAVTGTPTVTAIDPA